jgi:hypothetical protein
MNLKHASINHPCKLIYHKELLSCRFVRFYGAVKFGPLLWSKKIHWMFQNGNETTGTYDTGVMDGGRVHSMEIHKLVIP